MPEQLYFIALLPPETLRLRVKDLKQEMRASFGTGHALKTPAHITIQKPFRLSTQEEERLFSVLKRFAGSQTLFPVGVEGFDCFPPRVIFLRIKDHRPIISLMEQLMVVLSENFPLAVKGPDLPFYPHMTIGTKYPTPAYFRSAWTEFKDRLFLADFAVHSIFLLKHRGRSWEISREFHFGAGS